MLEIAVNAGVSIAALMIAFILAWLAKQANQRMKTGAAKDAAIELVTSAGIVARSLEQTMKPILAANARDGKLTVADGRQLQDAALLALHDQLSEQAKKVMKSNETRVEEAMIRAIEAQVHQIRAEEKGSK